MNLQLMGLVKWWESEFQATVRMIEAIPPKKMQKKIHKDFRPLGELALHISVSILGLIESLEKGKVVFYRVKDVPGSIEALVDLYKSNFKKVIARLETLTDEQLNRKIPMEVYGKIVWEPRGFEMLHGYICHEIHHRAQMGVLIRMAGGKVPSIYGPTADAAM